MLGFRVRLNRRRVATVGIPGPHVLTAIISSIARENGARRSSSKGPADELTLELGGLAIYGDGTREDLRWPNRDLKVGDTITLTVVHAVRVDRPIRKTAVRKIQTPPPREQTSGSGTPSNKPLKRMVGRRRPPTA